MGCKDASRALSIKWIMADARSAYRPSETLGGPLVGKMPMSASGGMVMTARDPLRTLASVSMVER